MKSTKVIKDELRVMSDINLNRILLNKQDPECIVLNSYMREIGAKIKAKKDAGNCGIIVFNKYIKPIYQNYADEKDETSGVNDYAILQPYTHGGLIVHNTKWEGYHKHLDGHGQDIISGYPWGCCGSMPVGKLTAGKAPHELCMQFVSYTFDKMEVKPKYKNIIPLFRCETKRYLDGYKFDTDGKLRYTEGYNLTNSRYSNKLNNITGAVWYGLLDEWELYNEIYDFENPVITYDYWYELKCDTWTPTIKELYAKKCAGDKLVNKLSLVSALGCVIQAPTKDTQAKKGYKEHTTHSASYNWYTWKVRERVIRKAMELTLLGNSVTHICTDCIYWVGEAPAERTGGLGGWGGIGDDFFKMPDGTSTKDISTFDEMYLVHYGLYCLDLNGHRIKTAHGDNETIKYTGYLDVVPPSQWQTALERYNVIMERAYYKSAPQLENEKK